MNKIVIASSFFSFLASSVTWGMNNQNQTPPLWIDPKINWEGQPTTLIINPERLIIKPLEEKNRYGKDVPAPLFKDREVSLTVEKISELKVSNYFDPGKRLLDTRKHKQITFGAIESRKFLGKVPWTKFQLKATKCENNNFATDYKISHPYTKQAWSCFAGLGLAGLATLGYLYNKIK